ncbi:unnamed protein product [Paramecium pentaurelia]|uniref:Uncharacterized protein n=1 Tax=Paramecium pentaurelia TaxID=43138 RepID=A0A8S1XV28_9CILI|nr:unnamed protein product [Paramecium pentaurelia]
MLNKYISTAGFIQKIKEDGLQFLIKDEAQCKVYQKPSLKIKQQYVQLSGTVRINQQFSVPQKYQKQSILQQYILLELLLIKSKSIMQNNHIQMKFYNINQSIYKIYSIISVCFHQELEIFKKKLLIFQKISVQPKHINKLYHIRKLMNFIQYIHNKRPIQQNSCRQNMIMIIQCQCQFNQIKSNIIKHIKIIILIISSKFKQFYYVLIKLNSFQDSQNHICIFSINKVYIYKIYFQKNHQNNIDYVESNHNPLICNQLHFLYATVNH